MTRSDPIVCGPGEGERLEAPHRVACVKAEYPELDLLEFELGPDHEGPRSHFHERHAHAFYVLDGELEFRVGIETVRARRGTTVLVPSGVVHAFTNPGPASARFLDIHTPQSRLVDWMRARERGELVDPRDFDVHYVGM
jgi:quercetin dioxygenase-like cupin family protein